MRLCLRRTDASPMTRTMAKRRTWVSREPLSKAKRQSVWVISDLGNLDSGRLTMRRSVSNHLTSNILCQISLLPFLGIVGHFHSFLITHKYDFWGTYPHQEKPHLIKRKVEFHVMMLVFPGSSFELKSSFLVFTFSWRVQKSGVLGITDLPEP